MFSITLWICQCWKGSFPITGVAGCKQKLGHTYLERAKEKAHPQLCDAAGTSGVSARAAGDRPTLLHANSPGMSPDLPSQKAEKSPALKLAFPTPFFFPLTPYGFGLGETSAAEKGWPCYPERRVATAPCAGAGTVPLLHPAPFIPAS